MPCRISTRRRPDDDRRAQPESEHPGRKVEPPSVHDRDGRRERGAGDTAEDATDPGDQHRLAEELDDDV